MSATSTWAAAKSCTVTYSSTQPVTDGTMKFTVSTFDTTNILGSSSANSQLWEEHGTDTISATLDFSVVVDTSNIKTYSIGALVTGVTVAFPDNVSHAGSARIISASKPIAAKGAWKIQLSTLFTGAVSNA